MTGNGVDAPILITGIGREGQVGEAVARGFARSGSSTLLLVDRSPEQARARAADIGRDAVRAFPYDCDLADASRVDALATRIRNEHGEQLRAVVHVAGGFALSGAIPESDLEIWQRMFAINLTTAYLVTRAFLPLLRPVAGSLVYFASEAVLTGGKVANISAYAAAKSGVVALMRAVAQEERASGVRANAIAPTAIRTASNIQTMGENVRYVEREEVAAAVAFLCSEAASAVTGQVIALS
jgi:NAD(P)-dependent dehydrogenase (short-subunit alcohol dehydrogenase family)